MDIKTTATYPYPIWGLPDNYKGDDPAGERKGLKKASRPSQGDLLTFALIIKIIMLFTN